MKKLILIAAVAFITACVTINVYFPEAKAKEVAEDSVKRIMGLEDEKEAGDKQSALDQVQEFAFIASTAIVDFVIPSAHAQGISPAVTKLENSLKAKMQQVAPYLDNGAVGLTNDGFLTSKNAKAVSPKERGKVKKLITAINSERKGLYKESARALGNPSWEKKQQSTYAQTWINQAKKGWWYQDKSGAWKQK